MLKALQTAAVAATCLSAALTLSAGVAQAATPLGETSTSTTGDCANGSNPYTEIEETSAGSQYTVPAGGGVITSWSHQSGPDESGTLKLKVYRATPNPAVYDVVGQSAPADLHPNALDGGPTRISVQPGDVLGYTRSADAVMQCLFTTSSLQDVVADAPTSDTAEGLPTNFDSGAGDFRINIAAVLEPDADHDGYGDQTQDLCPTDPATQGACAPPPLTGLRAAALKKCKKKHPRKAAKKCRRKARKLPV